MILEPSNYDFRTQRTETVLPRKSFKTHSLLMTEHRKHRFLYDRMILEPFNYDF